MTREEIEKFSRIEPYCFETDREEDWYRIGCIDGMEAADANPDLSSLWHDASEQPEDDIEPLIYSVDNGNFFGIENAHNLMIEIVGKKMRTWKKTVEYEGIDKWAYIRDIFPKEGKK